ncbi:LOW QUALITY PROTEIN: glucosidase, partial [Kutzneria sp. 744]
MRWFQYGVFCPLFRLHGHREPRIGFGAGHSGGPNEVWSYGEEAYEIIADQLRLRETLRDYIHQHLRAGSPLQRPLFVDFPDDAPVWTVEEHFLFGPDLLVAPVTELGAALGVPTGVGSGFLYGLSQDGSAPADNLLRPLSVK